MTRSEQNAHIQMIAVEMIRDGVDPDFVSVVVRTAMEFDVVFDLMSGWMSETDKIEKQFFMKDIREMTFLCSMRVRND